MKRYTITSLRRDIRRVLLTELRIIYVTETPKDCTAHSDYTDTAIWIWVDRQTTRLDYAVVHEILHKILDKHLEPLFTYSVYEKFIAALEEPIFFRLPHKERIRWKGAIDRKIVVGHRN